MERRLSEATPALPEPEDALEGSISGCSTSGQEHSTTLGTSSRTGEGDSADGARAIRAQLSKELSRNVFMLRILVVTVLCIACSVLSLTMYGISVNAETQNFENQYHGVANKVIEHFEDLFSRMGAVASMGMVYASTSSKEDWPFVSLKDFLEQANHARFLSGAHALDMHPIVREQHFEAWNQYATSADHQEWILDAKAHAEEKGIHGDEHDEVHNDGGGGEEQHGEHEADGEEPTDVGGEEHHDEGNEHRHSMRGLAGEHEDHNNGEHQDEQVVATVTSNYYTGGFVGPMHYIDFQNISQKGVASIVEEPGSALYLPLWQTSPYVGANRINGNLLKDPSSRETSLHVIDSGKIVVGGYLDAPPGGMDSPHPTTALLAALDMVYDEEQGHEHGSLESGPVIKGDPMSIVYVPIFDSLQIREPGGNRNVVGVLTALYHWLDLFASILPDNTPPIVLVLEYECGSGFIHDHAEEHKRMLRKRKLQPSTHESNNANETNHHDGDESHGGETEDEIHVEEEQLDHGTNSSHNVTEADHQEGDEGHAGETDDENHVENEDHDQHNEEIHSDEGDHGNDEKSDHSDVPHGSFFTYELQGSEPLIVGSGDLHDSKFDKWRRDGTFKRPYLDDGTASGIPVDVRCGYRLHLYPSQQFVNAYITNRPMVITIIIVGTFIFAIIMFACYDRVVDHRQQLILAKATQSTTLLATLFPKNVRDRLLEDAEHEDKSKQTRKNGLYASNMTPGGSLGSEKMIAELFPYCTVFFADISGFTAWSSTREPSQVFHLLQSVYQAFDALAKRRRVFKVETIGDSYMAVTGLPVPQKQHAVIMVRFAWDCMQGMREITRSLESELGPETAELSMRFGLHSGPVTGGVLRGDKARFQLFGDTVNTASRMESTGERGKVQVSESTASLLRKVGKEKWLVPREDAVKAKGKGVLATYWAVKPGGGSSCGDCSSEFQGSDGRSDTASLAPSSRNLLIAKSNGKERLVDWVVRLLLEDIKKVVSNRHPIKTMQRRTSNISFMPPKGQTFMKEVREIIQMPKFDVTKVQLARDNEDVQIEGDVIRLLGDYVSGIAMMYRENPFHNFDHACHVAMSVKKLLRRVVSAESPSLNKEKPENVTSHEFEMQQTHDFTHGLSSDPLCMLALTFSALIHDVDHRGISNTRLAQEAPEMATKYESKSIAEQNSLDMAWNLLMEERFAPLRCYVFESKEELLRFRQYLVNVVLATDIFDPELNGLRKKRWDEAFSPVSETEEESLDLVNDRRATIVIEHMMQASDVSHTMQHWHVYQKWNKCLFKEMCAAYKAGRLSKDPATFWYRGEIGFFDNYIIPLAKKLEACGVFGVSSEEYLNYALQNRAEWADRGESIVSDWVAEAAMEERDEPPEVHSKDHKHVHERKPVALTDYNGMQIALEHESSSGDFDSEAEGNDYTGMGNDVHGAKCGKSHMMAVDC